MSSVERWAWRLTITFALVVAVLANFTTINSRAMGVLVLILAIAGIIYALLNLRWLKQQRRELEDLKRDLDARMEKHGDHLSDL